MSNIFKSYNELSTLGARVLHAPHPDGRPKAGKNEWTARSERSERRLNRRFRVKI